MRVFISWSGDQSHQYALLLDRWLPSVLQAVTAYVSSEQIESGMRWAGEIAKELSTDSFGILCLTGEAVNSPWVNFEAGALSKAIDGTRVVPLLFGLNKSAIGFPLAQFQMRTVDESDLRALVQDINRLAPTPLEVQKVNRIFDVWWPQFNDPREEIANKYASADSEMSKQTETSPILEAILESVRTQQRLLSSPELFLPREYLRSVIDVQRGGRYDGAIRHVAGRLKEATELIFGASELTPEVRLAFIKAISSATSALGHVADVADGSNSTKSALKDLARVNSAFNQATDAAVKALSAVGEDDEIPF